MAKRKKQPSDVQQLLQHMWHRVNKPTNSWERINHSMHQALCLAITSGYRFEPDDFAVAYEAFQGGHWFTAATNEYLYGLAIRSVNLSAALSFEHWKGRPPFIADDVGNRKRERLAVGSQFHWKGSRVKVTSFADDHLTACSYKDDREGKVAHLYLITPADIKVDRKQRKEFKAVIDRWSLLNPSGFEKQFRAWAAKILKRGDGDLLKSWHWTSEDLDAAKAQLAKEE